LDDLEQKLNQFEDLIHMALCETNRWGSSTFSKQQFLLLITLFNKTRITVSSLADELNLSASATTLAINRLVRDGHIIRTRDETDRSVVWVELSESAKLLVTEMKQRRRRVLRSMIESLEEAEIDQFLALVTKMFGNLRDPG
jgi:DNA-binding MarR family transcriptional regulator